MGAHKVDSSVVVEAKDTCFGIRPGERTRIFDKFKRVKNEYTRRTCGTGLGLAIAKRIVESHRGYIEVTNEVDRGSTFRVHLPSDKTLEPTFSRAR